MGKLSLKADHAFNPEISDITNESLFKQLSILINNQQKINDELSEIAEKVRLDLKAKRYANIINRQTQLSGELDKNQRLINTEIKEIKANEQFKVELRRLPQRNLRFLGKRNKLAEDLSEEKITLEEAEEIKIEINNELYWLGSEAIRRLYAQDLEVINATGISEQVIPYLKDLSHLDEEIYKKIEVKVDNFSIEAAEELIARNSAIANRSSLKNIYQDQRPRYAEFNNEEESLPPIYTATTVDAIYELILNGADPIRESKGLSITPLAQQFALKYVLDQELNGVNLHAENVQAQL